MGSFFSKTSWSQKLKKYYRFEIIDICNIPCNHIVNFYDRKNKIIDSVNMTGINIYKLYKDEIIPEHFKLYENY
jgi:hypothetical protein